MRWPHAGAGVRGRAGAGARWLLLGFLLVPSAGAVLPGYGPPPEAAIDDPDYAAGFEALEREDWAAAVVAMERVIEAQPWRDDAHALAGYALRRQGDYPGALAHYDRALALNPYNRPAMAYLGMAYLALERPGDALALLVRLEAACRRLAAEDWRRDCREWEALEEAIDAYHGEE